VSGHKNLPGRPQPSGFTGDKADFRLEMASLQVLQQLDVILSAGKVVSTGGSVSVMV
jgi:hypothetical protein